MIIRKLLGDVVMVFSVSFIVSVIVSLLWSLIVHGSPTIDWETSFRFAILFGIIFPWMQNRRSGGTSGSRP